MQAPLLRRAADGFGDTRCRFEKVFAGCNVMQPQP